MTDFWTFWIFIFLIFYRSDFVLPIFKKVGLNETDPLVVNKAEISAPELRETLNQQKNQRTRTRLVYKKGRQVVLPQQISAHCSSLPDNVAVSTYCISIVIQKRI